MKNTLSFNLIKSNYKDIDLVLADAKNLNLKEGSLYRGLIDKLLFFIDFNDNKQTISDISESGVFLINTNNTTLLKSGSLNTDFIPTRTENGFTLNFWLNHQSSKQKSDLFFYLGSVTKNFFKLTYDGENLILNQNVNKKDINGNVYYKSFQYISNLKIDEGNWFNITVTFNREKNLQYCDETATWLPEPIIVQDEEYCDGNIPSTQKGILKFFFNARPIGQFFIEEPILNDGSILSVGENFNGQIGLIAIYNEPLTVPEIISNFLTYTEEYHVNETFGGIKTVVNEIFKL